MSSAIADSYISSSILDVICRRTQIAQLLICTPHKRVQCQRCSIVVDSCVVSIGQCADLSQQVVTRCSMRHLGSLQFVVHRYAEQDMTPWFPLMTDGT